MKIGILSDIHEDGIGLREVLAAMEKRGVDEIACLGDVVGFDVCHYRHLSSRDASYCLDTVRRSCRWVVAGNHDLFAIRKLPDVNGCFAFPADWYQLDFHERKRLAGGQVWLFENQELPALLSARDRDYLAGLPLSLAVELDGVNVLFSHALFPDLSGTLTWRPQDHWDFQRHFKLLRAQGCRLGFCGHLHPDGIAVAGTGSFSFSRFRTYRVSPDLVQYVCPSTAGISGKSGFLVLDMANSTLEAAAVRSHRARAGRFR